MEGAGGRGKASEMRAEDVQGVESSKWGEADNESNKMFSMMEISFSLSLDSILPGDCKPLQREDLDSLFGFGVKKGKPQLLNMMARNGHFQSRIYNQISIVQYVIVPN